MDYFNSGGHIKRNQANFYPQITLITQIFLIICVNLCHLWAFFFREIRVIRGLFYINRKSLAVCARNEKRSQAKLFYVQSVPLITLK